MYCLGLFFAVICCLHVNKIVYEDVKMLLHDLSWIPTFVQSLISIILSDF